MLSLTTLINFVYVPPAPDWGMLRGLVSWFETSVGTAPIRSANEEPDLENDASASMDVCVICRFLLEVNNGANIDFWNLGFWGNHAFSLTNSLSFFIALSFFSARVCVRPPRGFTRQSFSIADGLSIVCVSGKINCSRKKVFGLKKSVIRKVFLGKYEKKIFRKILKFQYLHNFKDLSSDGFF